MQVIHYPYSVVNVDRVSLTANEEIRWEAPVMSESYGSFYYSGGNTVTDGNAKGLTVSGPGNWYPNTWSNDEVGHSLMAVRAFADGAEWLCVSQNDTVRREVQYQQVQGSYTLPAGWGFVTLNGEVTADGKTAIIADYFRPRATDIEVSGTADLLLVR